MVAEVQWSESRSFMSTPSHKRRRRSQKAVRESCADGFVLTRVGNTANNTRKGIAKNPPSLSNEPSRSSTEDTASVPPSASSNVPPSSVVAYETPNPQKQAPQEGAALSEPSTFLDLAAANDLSTIPSSHGSTVSIIRLQGLRLSPSHPSLSTQNLPRPMRDSLSERNTAKKKGLARNLP